MPDKLSQREMRDAQRKALELARRKTLQELSADEGVNYTAISADLETYDTYFSSGGETFSGLVERAHQRHPGEKIEVLDFGCGTGTAIRQLHAKEKDKFSIGVTGISAGDVRTESDKEYDSNHLSDVEFIDQTEASFAPPNERYHVIVSKTTFTHLYDPLQVLKRLYKALRDGGELYITLSLTDLAVKFQSTRADSVNFMYGKRRAEEFIALMQKNGINVRMQGVFMHIKKNSKPLRFPYVKYKKPLSPEGDGLYSLIEAP